MILLKYIETQFQNINIYGVKKMRKKYNINWNNKRTSIYFTELESELFMAQNNLKNESEIKNQIQKICDKKEVIFEDKQSPQNLSEFIKYKMMRTAILDSKKLHKLKNPTLF